MANLSGTVGRGPFQEFQILVAKGFAWDRIVHGPGPRGPSLLLGSSGGPCGNPGRQAAGKKRQADVSRLSCHKRIRWQKNLFGANHFLFQEGHARSTGKAALGTGSREEGTDSRKPFPFWRTVFWLRPGPACQSRFGPCRPGSINDNVEDE